MLMICKKNQVLSHRRYLVKFVFAIHKIKPVLTLNEAIYVVFSILDLRKLLIYEFNYKYDTNSLVYEIEANAVYEDF